MGSGIMILLRVLYLMKLPRTSFTAILELRVSINNFRTGSLNQLSCIDDSNRLPVPLIDYLPRPRLVHCEVQSQTLNNLSYMSLNTVGSKHRCGYHVLYSMFNNSFLSNDALTVAGFLKRFSCNMVVYVRENVE